MDHKKKHPKVKDHQNRNRSTARIPVAGHFPCFGLACLAGLACSDQKEASWTQDQLHIHRTWELWSCVATCVVHNLDRLWTGSITCVATGGDESALCFAIVKSTRRLCHPHAVAAGDPPQRHIDTSWKVWQNEQRNEQKRAGLQSRLQANRANRVRTKTERNTQRNSVDNLKL